MRVGQGAAQAMEDASVIADALQHIDKCDHSILLEDRIRAAFHGFEAARRARFETVLTTSIDAFGFWSDFCRPDLSQKDIEQHERDAFARFEWMWNEDMNGQGSVAVAAMEKVLLDASCANGYVNEDLKRNQDKRFNVA